MKNRTQVQASLKEQLSANQPISYNDPVRNSVVDWKRLIILHKKFKIFHACNVRKVWSSSVTDRISSSVGAFCGYDEMHHQLQIG